MTDRDAASSATPTQPQSPAGVVAATPEAGPAAPTPPAWRDQFADPILQPGQAHDPNRAASAPVAATPEAGPVTATIPVRGQEQNRAAMPTPPQPPVRPAPPVAPLAREETTVLEPGQVSPEAVVQSVKAFVEASPEERNRKAREVGRALRPIAADAEVLVARALNLGARGLNGLAARIERRRKEREDAGRG